MVTPNCIEKKCDKKNTRETTRENTRANINPECNSDTINVPKYNNKQ